MPHRLDLGALFGSLPALQPQEHERPPAVHRSYRVLTPTGPERWTVSLWRPQPEAEGWSCGVALHPVLPPVKCWAPDALEATIDAARLLRVLLDDALIQEDEAGPPPQNEDWRPPHGAAPEPLLVQGLLADELVLLGEPRINPNDNATWYCPLRIGDYTREVIQTDAVYATLTALRRVQLAKCERGARS